MFNALIVAVALATQVPALKDALPPEVTVVRVVDGDTILVEDAEGRRDFVRLVGIDTPETVHPTKGVEPFGPEASAFTKKSLLGQKVRLVADARAGAQDRYKRKLAYVFVGQESFNEVLVREGYAKVYTKYPAEPAARTWFLIVEEEARRTGKGLWGRKG